MKVYADYRPERRMVIVYVELKVNDDGSSVFQTADFRLEDVPLGGVPPEFMRIPEVVAERVGEALAPRPQVTERHLDDAIEVRDRLLTIVEMNWRSK